MIDPRITTALMRQTWASMRSDIRGSGSFGSESFGSEDISASPRWQIRVTKPPPPVYTPRRTAGDDPGKSVPASVVVVLRSTSRVSQHTIRFPGGKHADRNREVVQRREGLRVHHARRSGQGPVRAFLGDLRQRISTLAEGAKVSYEAEKGPKGPERARNVQLDLAAALDALNSNAVTRPASVAGRCTPGSWPATIVHVPHAATAILRRVSASDDDFTELGLAPEILEAIRDVGYELAQPDPGAGDPAAARGLDVIGQAQTGSGKTAAFGLPMLQYVDPTEHDVQGLVLTPTRELCIQVTQALRAYGKRKGVDVVAVFGGAPIRTQQAQLRAGGHVVVGTVGRVKDLISRHSLMLHACRFVVLDEADEMLDLGFLEDVERILALTPSSRQTALFSATMPPEIRRLADQYLYDPVIDQGQDGDADRRHRRAVRARGPAAGEGRPAGRGAAGRAARPGDRVRAHEDPLRPALPDAARPGHERQGAARRHEPGRARRRDDLVQGRAAAAAGGHRRRRARPRHRRRLAHHQLRRARPRPTCTCTGSGAPGASGAAAARSRSTSRASGATSRRSSGTPASSSRRGSKDAHVAPTPVTPKPRRALQAARQPRRRRPAAQADRLRRPGRGARALGHHPRDHRGHRPGRRGGAQRARARAVRVRRGARAARPSAWSSRSSGTEVRGHGLTLS